MREQTPELPAEDDWAGDLMGAVLDDRYQVESLLGTGGMGAVYLGQQITLRKKVAIKVLRPEYAHREIYVRRFLREARAASMIGHRHVVEVTDFGQAEGGRVYFVMEHLEGEDLAKLVKRAGRLSWTRTRGILLQMVRALKAAHLKGVIHRDIKPANVFLVSEDEGDFVKVLDFGIAKVADPLENSLEGLTSSNQMIGTAMYMAPEQALGRGADARSDIYSLGAVAFQLLTGRVPFDGVTAFEVLMKRVNEPPPPLRPLAPELTSAIEDLVRRAMAREPAARFQDMAEIEAALSDIPADACPEPSLSDAAGPAPGRPYAPRVVDDAASDPDPTHVGTRTSARHASDDVADAASDVRRATVAYAPDDVPSPEALRKTLISESDPAPVPPGLQPPAASVALAATDPTDTNPPLVVAQPHDPAPASRAWVLALLVAVLVAGGVAYALFINPATDNPTATAPTVAAPTATDPPPDNPAVAAPAKREGSQAARDPAIVPPPQTPPDKPEPEPAADATSTPETTPKTPPKPTPKTPPKPTPKTGPKKKRVTVDGAIARARRAAAKRCDGKPGTQVELKFVADGGKPTMVRVHASTADKDATACVVARFQSTTLPAGNHGLKGAVIRF